ncbi:MAG: lasso peptide biosynthesis B2 protein [Acidobacteriota bacterium]|nr:lasso peptide biosynthesis B2 protein [Acidobacteriota bacterium]
MIFEALLLPISISVGARLLGVSRVQALLRQWSLRTTRAAVPGPDLIRDARRAQAIAKRLVGWGGNCLARSLTLWTILLRRGLSTDLRVGFRKREGRFEGHAWLEHEGAPVNETISEVLTYQPYERPMNFDQYR